MRKFATGLGVLLAVVAAQPASAQVALGFRAGASVSDLSLEAEGMEPDLDSSTGFLVGAFLDVPLSGNLFFQPGLQYVQKGAEMNENFEGEDFTFGIELTYVEVPLLLKYVFPTGGAVGVHLFGGPALGFETGCEIGIEGGGFDASVDCDEGAAEEDIEIDTKSFDFGALFGGGVSFQAGPGSLLVEGGYNLGLANLADDAGDDSSAKNRAFYVTAGYAFPIN